MNQEYTFCFPYDFDDISDGKETHKQTKKSGFDARGRYWFMNRFLHTET
jgi:hypothetical protein